MTRVRLATSADSPALLRLRHAWAQEKGAPLDDDSFAGRFAAWLDSESDRRLFWLAHTASGAVGMVNLVLFTRMPYPDGTDFASHWGYLSNLFVEPQHRGAGLGAELVEACTGYADDHGFARIVLAPSAASVPLYERHGFGPATGLMVRRQGPQPH